MTKALTAFSGSSISTQAPSTPPATPAGASRLNRAQSTFLFHTWDAPASPVVTISAACTLALASAGDVPVASSAEVAIRP